MMKITVMLMMIMMKMVWSLVLVEHGYIVIITVEIRSARESLNDNHDNDDDCKDNTQNQ